MPKSIRVLALVALVALTSCGNNANMASKNTAHATSNHSPNPKKTNTIVETTDDVAETQRSPITETVKENPFVDTKEEITSTFSIDVDNASYSNIRTHLLRKDVPRPDMVRIEEMVNYFDYNYPQPTGEHPFSFNTEVSTCPWNTNNRLVHIGIQGRSMDYDNLQPSNLVFLIDVSGSMERALPLVKKSFRILLKKLSARDRVSVVVYAGAAGLVLPSTPANQRQKIFEVLDNLQAGGSTAGGEGIHLAYRIAEENLIKDGNNRVVLCTDGDFNVGVSNTSDLVNIMNQKRQKDIFLTICGFDMDNYQDHRLEAIAQAGSGNYFFLDNSREAQKVFGKEMIANMFTIAKDVKIQIDFDPTQVKSYRLIGYENRVMANEDFDNDQKDAGELGAGHNVTALYEIVPVSQHVKTVATTDPNLFDQNSQSKGNPVLFTLKFRYKKPKGKESILIEHPVYNTVVERTSDSFRFSAAVASFGMLLRNSQYKGDASFEKVINLAEHAKGDDPNGDRIEFLNLVDIAKLNIQ